MAISIVQHIKGFIRARGGVIIPQNGGRSIRNDIHRVLRTMTIVDYTDSESSHVEIQFHTQCPI
jgi:hypothetical protein